MFSKSTIELSHPYRIHRSTSSIHEENQSIDSNYLEEENRLLKEILHQAATAIDDVIQVRISNELSSS